MSKPTAHRDLITLRVTEVMSGPVLSVRTDVALGDVLATMVRTRLRHVAVVDGAFRCVGVVGDRALAAAWAADPTALQRIRVGRILDSRPSIVGADSTIGDVARAMHGDGVDAVAVINRAGAPVGMITGADLVALMANQTPERIG